MYPMAYAMGPLSGRPAVEWYSAGKQAGVFPYELSARARDH